MAQEVVIVDQAGTEHVFPDGFDPQKAAAIVRSQQIPTAPPASASAGMVAPSTAQGDPGLLGRQLAKVPLSIDRTEVMGQPIGPLPSGALVGAVTGAPGRLAGTLTRLVGANKARGAANIAEAVTAAKDVPLSPEGVASATGRMMQYKGIERVPMSVRKLAGELSSDVPMTVERARQYYPAISRMSANEWNSLTPNMQRLMGGVRAEMNTAITNAADTVGKGEQYAQGMKEFARGAKLQRTIDENVTPAMKYALKYLLGGGALGAGYEVYKHLSD